MHPYLWNFVEADRIASFVENAFSNSQIDTLNDDNVVGQVDRYVGEFGNTIGLWNDTGIDHTGYQTRYEASNHMAGIRNDQFQKVVGYDGAFFPDAVDFWFKNGSQAVVEAIQHGIDGTPTEFSDFYEDYYRPLGLSRQELVDERERVIAFSSQISDVASDHTEDEVYDMYRYGTDQYGNSYCLFKRYRGEGGDLSAGDNVPFGKRRNTPGKLWIRRASFPFAFPAFAAENGAAVIDD